MNHPALVLIAAVTAVAAAAAQQPATHFDFEIVDGEGDTGFHPSIVLDPADVPHIGYTNLTQSVVRYARWSQRGWSTEDVATHAGTYAGRSLAIDTAGRRYLAFNSGGAAQCAVSDSTGWRVDFLGGCQGPSAIALAAAPDGSVHGVIGGSCSGGIYYGAVFYVIRTDQGWVQTTAGYVPFPYRGGVSLVARSASELHLAPWDDPWGTYHARWSAGDWMWEPVGGGAANSIALDASGVPHITLQGNKTLQLAIRTPDEWLFSTIDDSGDVGGAAALAIARDGGLHVAFYDATHGDVKYARRPDGTSDWSIQTVAASGDVGSSLDLALDSGDEVHIAFYDRTHGDLVYATTRRRVAVRAVSWGELRARYR